jgi:hypothetical protein
MAGRLAGRATAVALAVTALTGTGSAAWAAPPEVDSFSVSFSDPSCGGGLEVLTELSLRFTDKRRPDGTLHHWIDLRGTLTVGERVVRVHATRRYRDDEAQNTSVFSGLQGQFSAPGEGVLDHNAGRAVGPYDASIATYARTGRWDGPSDLLPAEVCDYLRS